MVSIENIPSKASKFWGSEKNLCSITQSKKQSEKEQNERKERRRYYSTTFIIVDKDKLLYNKSQINQDIKVSD